MEGSPGAGASAISWRGLESHLYFVNSPLKCNKRTLLGSSSFHHKLSFNKAWDLSFKSFRVKFLDAIILIPQEKPNVRESSDLCEGLSRQGEGAMHRLEIILRHCHCPPPLLWACLACYHLAPQHQTLFALPPRLSAQSVICSRFVCWFKLLVARIRSPWFVDMTRSQMLRRTMSNLSAKFWRLVACTKIVSR